MAVIINVLVVYDSKGVKRVFLSSAFIAYPHSLIHSAYLLMERRQQLYMGVSKSLGSMGNSGVNWGLGDWVLGSCPVCHPLKAAMHLA